jgi:hypothetical protein
MIRKLAASDQKDDAIGLQLQGSIAVVGVQGLSGV